MSDAPRPRYHLTLEAMPDDVPPIHRLRRALKVLLRSFRLFCVEARESSPAVPIPPTQSDTNEVSHATEPTR
jgi:hypothetical protein